MNRVLSKCKPQNKIKAAILHFDSVATFNCAVCNFIDEEGVK